MRLLTCWAAACFPPAPSRAFTQPFPNRASRRNCYRRCTDRSPRGGAVGCASKIEPRQSSVRAGNRIRRLSIIIDKECATMRRLPACLALAAVASAGAETHDLKLTPPNVHWGYYDARLKPVLRIASGDTVRVETMVAGGLERLTLAGVPDSEIPDSLKQVEKFVTDRGPGAHPLTGPIYVEGAEPGDVLEVRILAFEFLHPYGVTGFRPGSGTLPDEFPYAHFMRIPIDARAGTAEFRPGVNLRLAPSWGSIGVTPPPPIRRLSSGPPGWHAGNLD